MTVNLIEAEETTPGQGLLYQLGRAEGGGTIPGCALYVPDFDACHRDGPLLPLHSDRGDHGRISLESAAEAQLFVSQGTPDNDSGTLPNQI